MEKHFVEEQPAYIHLMRKHNEVDNLFLILVYSILGGVIIYIIYTVTTKRKKLKQEDKKKNENIKLKFVEVFIKETSKNFSKMFQDYYNIREKLIQ